MVLTLSKFCKYISRGLWEGRGGEETSLCPGVGSVRDGSGEAVSGRIRSWLGGYSVTFNARYIIFNAQFYMVLYIYVYKNSAR